MLQEISLTNFKLFKRMSLELATITVLIGPQGTGKSSVLDALGLLAQSAGREGLNLDGSRIKDVHFSDLVHKHVEQEVIGFGLKIRLEGALPPITDGPYHTVGYMITFGSDGLREQRAVFTFPERELEFRTPKIGRWTVPPPLEFENRPKVTFAGSFSTLLPFRFDLDGRDYPLQQNLKILSQEIHSHVLGGLHMVPAHRLLTDNLYPDQGGAALGMWGSINDVVNTLAYRWDLRDRVSDWLYRLVDRRVNFRGAGDRIAVEASNTLLHPITNEGGGVRQLIWPLAALAVAEPGSLIAIEEPEIHLHPQAQARLSQLLMELATREDKMILLTTHSEHILMAFLTAIARGELRPDDLAIHYLSEQDGVGTGEKLPVDELGMIEGGLRGFFEAGLEELETYLEALSGRSEFTDEA